MRDEKGKRSRKVGKRKFCSGQKSSEQKKSDKSEELREIALTMEQTTVE
jgi:hypothetical protein